MATPISTVDLYNAYLAYFGRPPEPEGLAYYSNKTEAQVLAAFSASEESRELLLGTNLADSINNVYLNLFNRDADTAGLNYWIEQIAGGTFTLAEAAMAILRGAQGDDLETVNAKNDAMVAFVAALDTTAEIIGYSGYEAAASARAFIATVGFAWDNGETVGPISVPTEAEIDAAVVAATTPGAVVGQELFLGVAQDRLNGDIAGDTFVADVMQNQLGAQVNSLGTGDRLDGNGGTDSLMAQVTEGANYGGLGAPIQPRTTSIEVVKLEALNSDFGTTGNSIGLDVEGIGKAVIGLIGSLAGNGIQDAMINGKLQIPGYIPLLAEKPTGVSSTEVYVNAKDMTDVTQMWSWYSDANLTVQNMTTLDENGGMRNLADMTIGMGYSGNKDSHWNESDYKVYFDQDYLVPGQSYNNEAFYWLLDQDAEQAGNPPLSAINVDGFLFKIGDGPLLELQSDAAVTAKTWEGFIAALQAPLQAMIAAGKVPADMTLTLDPTNADFTFLDNGNKSGPIPAMVLGTKENVIVKPLGFSQVEQAIGEYNVYGRFSNDSDVQTDLLEIGVALEKVGLAGPGGELVIGSMDKTECNVWSDDKAGHGIQQFNVTVYGNEAKSSSLAGLHSTNNNLEKVVVTSGVEAGKTEKDYADLTIGNSNTRVPVSSTIDLFHALGGAFGGLPIMGPVDFESVANNGSGSGGEDGDNQGAGSGNLPDQIYLQFLNDQADCFDCDDVFSGALKDVQTFDSTAFLGDLTLFASLTSEITDKYLDLQDTQDDPTADNVEFDYITGVGDDYVALTVSANNYADAGAATREDFELVINTGAGNDQVVLDIVDCDGEDDSVGGNCSIDEKTGKMTQWGFDNWYDNQKLNANMTIVTGSGNDVVRTGASGDFIIDTGADNDTVYLQNTGSKAAWVYNTITNGPIHTEITNLQSDVNDKYQLFDATLTVQFRHLTATVALPNGAAPGYLVSDLQVNQAIKKAINSDPVLSKLLVANDGPANTLVVSALIDGDQSDDFGLLGDDLLIKINSPKAADLSSGEVSQLATAWNLPGSTAASLVAVMDTSIAAFTLKNDYGQTYATHVGAKLDGSDSDGTSDNHVTLGTGNDVAVLGTGWLSNDVVIYDKPAFGNDVIVNFDSTWYEAGGQWDGGTPESIVLTFSSSDGLPVGQTIVFDGDTITLAAPVSQGVIPALDVAQQFADQFGSANWKVTAHTPGSDQVTITRTVYGNVTDVTASDFTGTYFGGANGNGTVGLAITQGTDVAVQGSKATFSVTYTTATTASNNGADAAYGGDTAAIDIGNGALSIAQEVAGMSMAGWDAGVLTKGANGASWTVTFTASNNGVVATPPTAADFLLEATDTNNVFGSFSFTQGVANTTKAPQFIVYPAHPGCGYDQLDFTGLGGKGSQFAGMSVSETNGSITVQALTNANDTAGEIAALYGNDSATATKHIFITYDTTNKGNVWQVVDAAGVVTGGNTTATLMGTIDLADTPWSSLNAVNFV